VRVLFAIRSLVLPEAPKYFGLGVHLLKRAIEDQDDLRDVQVEIVDRSIFDPAYAGLILDSGPWDVVGFSCLVWNLEAHLDLARQLKERNPQTLIVLGGHSAVYQKAEILDRCPWIDAIVNGEGEVAIVNLLRAHRAGESLHRLDGVCTREHRTSPMLPNVARPPVAFKAPHEPLSQYYILESMRGCVYACDYCTWWVGQRKVRYFGDAYIEANLRHALESGYRKVFLVDAAINFANGPLDTIAACVRRVDPNRTLKFWYFVQWSHFSERQMPSFEALGVDTIHVGLESANPAVLERAHRNWDEKKLRACVKSLSTIATPVVDIVLGLPGDTVEEFKRTIDFVVSLDVNVLCFRLMLYPGSEFYNRREELGLQLRPGLMPFVSETPEFKRDDMETLTEDILRRTYFNPENRRYFLYEPVDYWEGGVPVVAAKP
jgi:radical SAM superfamily enzyme YgiQ (UPF0313 family)